MTRGLASSGSLAIRAESAGAVLAANLLLSQPSTFGAAVLRMPFLDLFTAMMDPQQELTQHEWEEWGDPRAPGGMQLLQELCPYKVHLLMPSQATIQKDFEEGSSHLCQLV